MPSLARCESQYDHDYLRFRTMAARQRSAHLPQLVAMFSSTRQASLDSQLRAIPYGAPKMAVRRKCEATRELLDVFARGQAWRRNMRSRVPTLRSFR